MTVIVPDSSETRAETSGFIPRRRTCRLVIESTSTTTVATSSIASSPIVRAARRSRGMCSSSSPTVVICSLAAAFSAFSPGNSTSMSSRDGLG